MEASYCGRRSGLVVRNSSAAKLPLSVENPNSRGRRDFFSILFWTGRRRGGHRRTPAGWVRSDNVRRLQMPTTFATR